MSRRLNMLNSPYCSWDIEIYIDGDLNTTWIKHSFERTGFLLTSFTDFLKLFQFQISPWKYLFSWCVGEEKKLHYNIWKFLQLQRWLLQKCWNHFIIKLWHLLFPVWLKFIVEWCVLLPKIFGNENILLEAVQKLEILLP